MEKLASWATAGVYAWPVDLTCARVLAERLINEHGLDGWTFRFDRAKRRFGLCDYGAKTISLSRHLTALNGEGEVRHTLLHEIAHALTPGAGHGGSWRKKCFELGIEPTRCYGRNVRQPLPRYLLVCPCCGLKISRERKSRRKLACKPCCDRYNGGRYSPRYRFMERLRSRGREMT
jgi:ribosomal protein L37AE/L43A